MPDFKIRIKFNGVRVVAMLFGLAFIAMAWLSIELLIVKAPTYAAALVIMALVMQWFIAYDAGCTK